MSRAARRLALATLVAVLPACRGDRLLRVESIPPGAVVRLDDTVVGATPIDIPFEHYGQRRLALYRPGYRTHTEAIRLKPRWWARFPIDIVTEVILPLGLDDVRDRRIELVPDAGEVVAELATEEFIDHASRARAGESLVDENIAGQPPQPGPRSGPGSGSGEGETGAAGN